MHFTVNLRSKAACDQDFSYGLVFIPTPVWVKGRRTVLNRRPIGPFYRMGGIKQLIQRERLEDVFASEDKSPCILAHAIGHGSIADLKVLRDDLVAEGFTVQVYGEIENIRPYEPMQCSGQ